MSEPTPVDLYRRAALTQTCTSPLVLDLTVRDTTAGTFMDVLIHTWDHAAATGRPADLDPELVDACCVMFLPDMPERGRAAGIVGSAVVIGDDATPQQRLLAAMGRTP